MAETRERRKPSDLRTAVAPPTLHARHEEVPDRHRAEDREERSQRERDPRDLLEPFDLEWDAGATHPGLARRADPSQ